ALPRHMQRPDVENDHASDEEREEIMQREEAVERRIADRETTPEPGAQAFADERNGTEEVGDDGCAPEAHLTPGKDVAEESRRHHQEVDQDAENPKHFARRLVGAVVKAAEHMDIDGDEEHRRAICVDIADEPSVVHVTHDLLDARKG